MSLNSFLPQIFGRFFPQKGNDTFVFVPHVKYDWLQVEKVSFFCELDCGKIVEQKIMVNNIMKRVLIVAW